MHDAHASDPLRLVLRSTEEQLDDRVGTVSNAKPAHEESTSELIALEETLSSAQQKAKQLVTLRRKIESEQAGVAGGDMAPSGARVETPPERPADPGAPAP